MKTAIIYSGAMRSFSKNQRNHAWYLWRHFPGAQFFCATHDDKDFESVKLFPEGTVVAKATQPEDLSVPAGCPQEWTQGLSYMHESYPISVSPIAVVGQLWMLNTAWDLYENSAFDADVIIRVRPDIWFHSFEDDRQDGLLFNDALLPWWGRFGGVNDRFAVMGEEAARHYFTTYQKLQTLIDAGAPLHPESLVHESLVRGGVHICNDLATEFSTIRVTGEVRGPEIWPMDLGARRR